jgi:hypothetical protein
MQENEAVETEEYKGFKIYILPETDPINSRDDEYMMGTMVCFHKRYNLGDKHTINSGDFSGWGEIQEYLRKEIGANIIIPLYLLDHSGLWMRAGRDFSDVDSGGWDSGMVGFIYTTPKRIRDMYGIKHITKAKLVQAEKELYNEVETYNDYLTGNVYGYYVEDPEGEHVDSCWGYYGDAGVKEAMKTAKASVDYEAEKRTEEIATAHQEEVGSLC